MIERAAIGISIMLRYPPCNSAHVLERCVGGRGSPRPGHISTPPHVPCPLTIPPILTRRKRCEKAPGASSTTPAQLQRNRSRIKSVTGHPCPLASAPAPPASLIACSLFCVWFLSLASMICCRFIEFLENPYAGFPKQFAVAGGLTEWYKAVGETTYAG